MLKVDSLKLRIERTIAWEPKYFERIEQTKASGETHTCYRTTEESLGGLKFGLQKVVISRSKGRETYTTLQISSKVLGNQHAGLISLSTIDDVADRISDTGIIALTSSDLLTSEVLAADISDDVRLQEPPIDYLNAIAFLRGDYRFIVRCYGTSVVFTSMSRRDPIRVTFYDKGAELRRAANRRFLNTLEREHRQDCGNILRIERNCRQKASLRRALGSKAYRERRAVYLNDLLSSNKTPNLDFLRAVRHASLKDGILDLLNYPTRGVAGLEKRLGMEHIIRTLNSDPDLIWHFLKQRLKGDLSRYRSAYRDVMKSMQAMEYNGGFPRICSLLDEIETRLERLSRESCQRNHCHPGALSGPN